MLAVWDSMRGREECSHIVTKGVCFVMIILRPSIFLPSIQETADAQCLPAQWVKKLRGESFLTGNDVPLRNLPNAKISLTIYIPT